MRNPFSEYRNREQLTVNLRWRLTSCEIQYLEFALQNCTCKKTKQTKKTKSEKGKSKQKPKKKTNQKPNQTSRETIEDIGRRLVQAVSCRMQTGRRPGKLQDRGSHGHTTLWRTGTRPKSPKRNQKGAKMKRGTERHTTVSGLLASLVLTPPRACRSHLWAWSHVGIVLQIIISTWSRMLIPALGTRRKLETGPWAPKILLSSSSWCQAAAPPSLPQGGSWEAPTSLLGQGLGCAWLRLPRTGHWA